MGSERFDHGVLAELAESATPAEPTNVVESATPAEPTNVVESTGLGPLPERMGITVIEASPQRVVGTMPVEGNTQPFSLLHGGASCVLAESLGSIGASLHALESFGGYALGVEISATHHRGARAGIVTGVATPLHLGGTIATYEVVITNEAGERVCTVRLTCLLRRP